MVLRVQRRKPKFIWQIFFDFFEAFIELVVRSCRIPRPYVWWLGSVKISGVLQ